MNSIAGDAARQHDVVMKFCVAGLEEMATAIKRAAVQRQQGSWLARTECRRT
jgi:hypothetical protein